MCLHSSGGWSTGDGAVAGRREHWGPPGSQAACRQPLRDQRGGRGPKGLGPRLPGSSFSAHHPAHPSGGLERKSMGGAGWRRGSRDDDISQFFQNWEISHSDNGKETALQSVCLLPLILVTGDLVSSWEILSMNSLGSHSWKKVP